MGSEASRSACPRLLYHYFESERGPFLSLTDLPDGQAAPVLAGLRQDRHVFASERPEDYLEVRRRLEAQVRALFVQKGGKPRRDRPHYMILGACPWVKSWYRQGAQVSIPLAHFHADIISFTFGDSFPALRFQDGKPYRGKVYLLSELGRLIEQHGLPQDWNPDGRLGPERYIEAQIWDDEALKDYLPLRSG